MNRDASKVRTNLFLAAILLVAFGLRVWGIRFGLPAYTRYHPDEHALVDRAAAILWTGNWNLERFNYPPFYAYLQAGAYAAYFLWGAARGTWSQVPPFTLPQYYYVGRLLTAFMGTLSVLVVYQIGKLMWHRRIGLLAAALLAACYLHVIHSHYATFDVMVAFLSALVLLFSGQILAHRSLMWYALAGICSGLAGATKYNGATIILVPLLAHVLATKWRDWGWLNLRLMVLLGCFLICFFGGNPFALGNLPDFLNGLATVLHHYGTQQPGFEGLGNWRWYLGVTLTSADALWFVAGISGLLLALRQDWRQGLLLTTFPFLYYVMISGFVVRFERNIVLLLPFLAIGGGFLLESLLAKLSDYTKNWRGNISQPVIVGLLLSIALALPLAASMMLDARLAQVDHRELAGQWVEENVPPGTKIAIEHYAIPFDYDRYDVTDVLRISEYDLDWYRQEGFDILIISDGVWPILAQQASSYTEEMTAWHRLFAEVELLAEFHANPPALSTAGYPTVAVYHFAPVHVLSLSE